MERFLGKFSPQIYGVLRIVAGLLFMQHGAQKLFGLLGAEGSVELLSLRGLAGVIEFFGGLLIVVGFKASVIGFIASGEMAFAYFMAHASRAPAPIQNGGELAVLYCFLWLYIAARGSGALSVDAALQKK